jgi:CxxC motif-containing protein
MTGKNLICVASSTSCNFSCNLQINSINKTVSTNPCIVGKANGSDRSEMGHFFVWSPKGSLQTIVNFDPMFWVHLQEKLSTLFKAPSGLPAM